MASSFDVVIEVDENGWFIGHVPELPGCQTQAKTRPELVRRAKEAIEAYLLVRPRPSPGPRFVGVERVEVAG